MQTRGSKTGYQIIKGEIPGFGLPQQRPYAIYQWIESDKALAN